MQSRNKQISNKGRKGAPRTKKPQINNNFVQKVEKNQDEID